MDVEVKKRGAERIAEDVSYKEAKHLSKYHGESIFSGLATGVNNFGEESCPYPPHRAPTLHPIPPHMG
jgi:hypothetical protein